MLIARSSPPHSSSSPYAYLGRCQQYLEFRRMAWLEMTSAFLSSHHRVVRRLLGDGRCTKNGLPQNDKKHSNLWHTTTLTFYTIDFQLSFFHRVLCGFGFGVHPATAVQFKKLFVVDLTITINVSWLSILLIAGMLTTSIHPREVSSKISGAGL